MGPFPNDLPGIDIVWGFLTGLQTNNQRKPTKIKENQPK